MRSLRLVHAIPYPLEAGFLLRSYDLLRKLTHGQAVDPIAFVAKTWATITLFRSLEENLAESQRVAVPYRDFAGATAAAANHS